MPVREKAVTKSIKNTDNKPGEGCQAQCYKIPFSQFCMNPAEKIEEDKYDMKDKEKVVSNFI